MTTPSPRLPYYARSSITSLGLRATTSAILQNRISTMTGSSALLRAYLYTRVSTTEQADRGYSLRDQEARLRQYCAQRKIEVVAHFQDDASAKTFERPAFKRLLARMRSNRGEVNLLLFVKWDRFSRDTTDGLAMIRKLEEYGVTPNAIEQPIDVSVPNQRMMLAINLMAPEVENLQRSLATRQGLRRAWREGRWTTTPPKGYRRSRDDRDKSILVLCDQTASFVQQAFHLAATTRLPLEHIRKKLALQGFQCSPNQFTLLLRNVVYKGKIRIPSWHPPGGVYEPEQIVDGLHEEIVSEALWQKVQESRFGCPKPGAVPVRKLRPELPLRGYLLCAECLAEDYELLLSGSGSRGRSRRYFYYHCTKRCQGESPQRVRADEVHAAFERFLQTLRIAPAVEQLYREILCDVYASDRATRIGSVRTTQQQMDELEKKLLRVDEKFCEEVIAPDSYERLKRKYASERAKLQMQLDDLKAAGEGLSDHLDYALHLFSELDLFYNGLDAEGKSHFLGSIFPEKLVFAGGRVRTAQPSPIIALFSDRRAKKQEADPWNRAGFLSGSPGRIRTYNPAVNSRMLYH